MIAKDGDWILMNGRRILVKTIVKEFNPRPIEVIWALVLSGMVHEPTDTEHEVFEAVIIPVGKVTSSIVLVVSNEDPKLNGVDRVIVIVE